MSGGGFPKYTLQVIKSSVPFYHDAVPIDGMTKEREIKITRLTPMFQDLYPWSI